MNKHAHTTTPTTTTPGRARRAAAPGAVAQADQGLARRLRGGGAIGVCLQEGVSAWVVMGRVWTCVSVVRICLQEGVSASALVCASVSVCGQNIPSRRGQYVGFYGPCIDACVCVWSVRRYLGVCVCVGRCRSHARVGRRAVGSMAHTATHNLPKTRRLNYYEVSPVNTDVRNLP